MSCLPFLRALLANLIRSGGRTILGYRSGSRPTKRTDPSYPLDTYAGTSTNKAYATAETRKAASENGSEEAILYDEPDLGGGIMKTTQVSVQEEKAPNGSNLMHL